jgi:hypothetical protein
VHVDAGDMEERGLESPAKVIKQRYLRVRPEPLPTYIELAPIEALRSKMPVKESGNFGERFVGLRRLSV